jgi:hypothetical protein
VGEGPTGPGPALPAGEGDGEAPQAAAGHEPVTRPWLASPANPPPPSPAEAVPPYPPTQAAPFHPSAEVVPPHPPTEAALFHPPAETAQPHPPTEVVPFGQPADVVRYGPGVPGAPPAGQPAEVVRYGPGVPVAPPAGQAGLTAEQVWRSGGPPVPPRRRGRVRRLLGSALTVILLAASVVVLYLRFHHSPLHVTGVAISRVTPVRCGVDVTGRIATNGAAGTVSYQWLLRPSRLPPQPADKTVLAGPDAVYVTDTIEGIGHGRASRTVTLQVLGPDQRTASEPVVIRCR